MRHRDTGTQRISRFSPCLCASVADGSVPRRPCQLSPRPHSPGAWCVVKRAVVVFGWLCLTLPLMSACSRTSAAPAGGGRGRGEGGGGVPVVVAQVTQKDVPVDIDGIGNVEAYATISVRAQVTGQLTDVLFREGDFVKKGDHIFSLDARPFEAMLQQAQANLVRDQALLSQSEANLTRDASHAEYAQLVCERNRTLAAKGIPSKDQADQSRSAADAPPVIATPQDADAEPANGALRFIDNAVDATTDTIKLKATFQNPDRRLWPGQFARVKLRLATIAQATIVPQQALQTGQDGQFVFVV